MVPILLALVELKHQMSGRYLEMIRRIPFAGLMEIKVTLQEELLNALMQRYYECTNIFRIGETLLGFKPKDVTIILGLRCDGGTIVFNGYCKRP